MSGTQGYVALEWILGELGNTLLNAQVGLEAVSESADAATSMRICLTAIHQVHGTLKMVQLEGPALMAAEMEQVAQSLMNNSITEVRLAQETLMQAILQLPAYLDRLHREQEDSEKNYLPMVNNLRAVRGEERIQSSGAELEEGDGPDLGPLTQAASGEVVNAYFQGGGEGNLLKIRTRYQQCLGEIFRKTEARKNLTTIAKLFTMLVRLCGDSPTGNLAELGLGVVEGVLKGGIKLDNQTATRLKQIDDHLKPLAQAGEHGLSMPVDEELAIGLIKLINGSKKDTKRISALRQRYASQAPESEEFAIGPDDETMSAVASILIEELNSVTDKLDLFVRAKNRNTNDLAALLPTLEQISSTMIILDNAEQQVAVASQISVIKGLETSGEPSEDVLLNMAQALIEIGVELGQLVVGSEKGREGDSFANLDEAQAAVIRETRIGLAAGKDSVIDFIASEFDHAKIEALPQSLNALRGGLMIVNQLQAGDVLKAAANYVANDLLSGSQTPELGQMDDLADAITSVDYYLERLLDNPNDPYLQMLEVAETAVKKLGYAVGAEAPAAEVVEGAAEVVEGAAPVAADLAEEVIKEVVEEPVEVTAPLLETEDDPIDDEILEIFVDEAEEVLDTIFEFLPIWKSEPTNEGALTEIRRAFHTLKGSGRLVGATVVGELAWSIENLLSRVIERTVTANPEVMDVITEAVGQIPEGVTAFKEGQQNRFKPDELVAIADALAEVRTPSAISTTAASEPEVIEESFELEEIIVTANVDSPEPVENSPELALDSPDGEEIFAIEAEEKLKVIDGFVTNPGDVSSDLVAAFHTLKGSAAMVEISSISTIATPLEHLANRYLVQNKPADQHLIDAVQEAASLIRTVLQDIAGHRDSVPGSDVLMGRLAVSAAEDQPAIGFDFREIKLLSEPNIATDGWQDVEALVSELKIAQEQGVTLNQPDLSALIASIRRIYSEGPSKPDDKTLSLMKRAHDHLVFMFDALASSQALRPAGGVIAELDAIDFNPVEVEATPEAMPEVLMAPEVESAPEQEPPVEVATGVLTELPADDILPIFLEETEELLEEIDQSIFAWSESGSPGGNLDNLLRQLHTMKGGARMAGAASLGEYVHNFETFLIGIQKTPIELDDEFFALLNKHQDEVIRRVEVYKKLSSGAASEEDLASLKSALEPALEKDPVEALYTATDDSAPAEPRLAIEVTSKDKSAASASQEMVRVSADLLEELIGLAGESSITRGRVEQQITDFSEYLEEMEETINRIRVQVRRLEIEADSRETLIRSRQGVEGDSGFDDLEMDRYTMLQAISRVLSEGSSDMMDLKDTLGNRIRDAETLLHQQARISAELQEGLTRTRMVQFSRLIPRLRRIVRQVSSEVGKSVRFDAYNIEGELDRNVLERIVAPLEHMLRNSVDHGIEDKEARVASGKQVQGRISLRLSREGGYVVLAISDDGGGIDVNAVRSKAIERGLITEGQDVSDHEVMQFIMHAGFSTAQKLTQISGRGVGMDVVGSEIKALGGSVAIDSTLGVGTEFTIRIPFTVSINRALMVVVKEETYAIPLNTIEGIVRVSPYELEAYYQPDAPMFEYAGQPYRLAYIGKMLDKVDDPNLTGQVVPLPVILARSGDHAVALQVDRVIGSREVVVKTLGAHFGDVGGISGATVLGDGSVVIILDCIALVRSYEASVNVPTDPVVAEAVPEPINKVRTVMIVDDSVTVRKVTSRLMERQGFAVATAKDGVDAMNQLQTIMPDVVLLDIEMPRMDGFEVLRSVRRDENLKDLPVIMITSRTGEKHKQQAMELGVNQYLGKPFQEAKLLATIEEVIASAKAKPEQN
jgi:chemosensory pili system protein ChpA (sensor histidine kinase/response regulator)